MDKSCGVVLFNSSKVLLLRHSSVSSRGGGHWDFPKGHIDDGETEIQTALRELEEETGIANVDLVEGFRGTITYTFPSGQERIGKEVVFFLATTKKSKVRLSHEHIDYSWLDFDSAFSRLTYDNARLILRNAIKFYENA
ncbi:MAG: diadenosine tetraphosphate hydrolase [Candidatus Marinimicrobia bacterium]|jgi:8-oxo-dGTP pyrophosphatase MutT (NUDIX family)|nr:diadenosine tetraphosphate hydrolase [Candidatus Neomarinimicrobiota bacterium]MCS5648133.1 NUDIX domain-containing protein [Dehalococcoidia bacterium]|tara:strand:- start:182 stop:598 length:417 start_codon:yes stop_codon:yes gene_type:complete